MRALLFPLRKNYLDKDISGMLHINFRMCVFPDVFGEVCTPQGLTRSLSTSCSEKIAHEKEARYGRVDKVSRPIGVDNIVATFSVPRPFREHTQKNRWRGLERQSPCKRPPPPLVLNFVDSEERERERKNRSLWKQMNCCIFF